MTSHYRDHGPLDCKVYVGDLGNGAAKHEIEAAFKQYGKITNTWIARNPPGFAFVEFLDSRDAYDAVRNMDGKYLCGRRCRVEMSNGKSRRPRGRDFDRPRWGSSWGGGGSHGGRYGGRSRYSRSRSRSRSPRRYRSRSRSPRRRSYSRSPRRRSHSRSPRHQSRSRSPRRRTHSRSPRRRSPAYRRSRSRSRDQSRDRSGDRSGRYRSRSRSPRYEKSRSRSRTPLDDSGDRSPPAQKQDDGDD